MKHSENIVKLHETLEHSSFDATISVLDVETSAFGAATLVIARRSLAATISVPDVETAALDAETSALGTVTSAIARSYRRYRRGVSGDIGYCTLQMQVWKKYSYLHD